jgi:hypothetical protein
MRRQRMIGGLAEERRFFGAGFGQLLVRANDQPGP